ncbi:MAG: sugar ABC transporter substrate-binding protein [Planctomycetota bacterium]|jgi:ribose transport system substrate-binding protein|nr:sugar ABC transporter substrate-binding protein [Planctomycetota bacterium]
MHRMMMLVSLVLSLSFTGIAANAAEKPKLAVSLPGSVEFFMVQRKGMDKAAGELGVELVYADAEWDPGKQLNQVEDFVAQKVDMILLCSSDNMALMPAVDLCRDAGIPLIAFTNVLGPNADGSLDGIVSFIGINDLTLGKMMGEMAEKLLGDKAEASIVHIEGTPGTSAQRMRTEGFNSVLAKHPGWKIVYSQAITGWTKEGALSAVEAFLRTKQNVDLISCQWHAAASAAAEALAEAGVDKKVFVTGLEYSRETVPYIKSGQIDMTTDASISGMGYKAIETAAKHLKGEKVPALIEIMPIIVDKANVGTVTPEL